MLPAAAKSMSQENGTKPIYALVTGANRGIGRETALQLAARGIHVVVSGRDLGACETLVAEITGRGEHASVLALDLLDPQAISHVLARLEHPIDVLINNAGIFPDPGVSVFAAQPDAVREAMQLHAHAPLQLAQALVPDMQVRGYGRVVNLTSGYASLSKMGGELTAYRTSKAALNGLTRILAAEVSGDVKVNAVDPGWVSTDMGGASAPRTAKEAGADVVWAATLPSDGPNGQLLRYQEIVDF